MQVIVLVLVCKLDAPVLCTHRRVYNMVSTDASLHTSKSSSPEEELIKSFQKLLLDTSGDIETLKTFDNMLTNEIERVSSNGSDREDNNEDPKGDETVCKVGTLRADLSGLSSEDMFTPESPLVKPLSDLEVNATPVPTLTTSEPLLDDPAPSEEAFKFLALDFSDFSVETILEQLSVTESQSMGRKTAYFGNKTYTYGRVTHNTKDYPPCSVMSAVSHRLSEVIPDFSFEDYTCLVTYYPDGQAGIPLHSDGQQSVAGSSIITISIGAERHLQIVNQVDSSLKHDIRIPHGSVYCMSVDSQRLWKHGIKEEPNVSGGRISFTFRKLTHAATTDTISSTLQPLGNGFLVHPGRIEQTSSVNVDTLSEAVKSLPCINRKDSPKHLIIGDSLCKGLKVPGSTFIFKGGIHPNEVIRLLPTSMDILHPTEYDEVKSVTLVVGTNALNVRRPGRAIPLMDVICDYEKLIYELTQFFPNAMIGLFNVIPRSYTCAETIDRIVLFNNLFSSHVTQHFPKVFWIKLYWEFVDDYGYLRQDLYGKSGIHLKWKGKALMAKTIQGFQKSYN